MSRAGRRPNGKVERPEKQTAFPSNLSGFKAKRSGLFGCERATCQGNAPRLFSLNKQSPLLGENPASFSIMSNA